MAQTQITDAQIELGDYVQDRISGMKGIVVAHGTHISGCDRYAVRQLGTGRFEEESWFFPSELTVIDEDDVEIPGLEATDPITEVDFELGERLVDHITGFEGYATTITYRLFNCPRVALTPTNDDNTDIDTDREWFDVPQVEYVGEGIAGEYEDLVESDVESETGPTGSDLREKSYGDLR